MSPDGSQNEKREDCVLLLSFTPASALITELRVL